MDAPRLAGQKRPYSSIVPTQHDLAASARKIGWIGEDHEVQAFFDSLSTVLTSLIAKKILHQEWIVQNDSGVDFIATVQKVQSSKGKKLKRILLDRIVQHFFFAILHNRLGVVTVLGLLVGFNQTLKSRIISRNPINGASIDLNINGTPMELAVQYFKDIKKFEMFDLLTKYGVKFPIDYFPTIACFLSSGVSDEAIAKGFLKRGVDINSQGFENRTALHFAAIGGNLGMLRFFIASGANLEAQDIHGQTPLHLVAERSLIDEATLLIESGANIDARDNRTNTPLMVARTFEMVTLLINEGADAELKNKSGDTALSLAEKNPQHYPRVIRLLKEATELKRLA